MLNCYSAISLVFCQTRGKQYEICSITTNSGELKPVYNIMKDVILEWQGYKAKYMLALKTI